MQYYNLGPETEQIEYKKTTSELKEGVISIAAILNKHGKGTLYFGVKNNGDVIGQEVNDETLRSVSQAIGNYLRPVIYPSVNKDEFDGRTVVKVAFEGNQQPYLAHNIPRIRVADEDLVMEQPMYEAMLRKRDNISYAWENQRSNYTIADIDKKAFEKYLRKAHSVGRISFESDDPSEVLTRLGLAVNNTLLNAGAALFVDCGINELQMAKYATNLRLNFTDMKRYIGSILDLSEKAVQYIIDAMDWRVVFSGKLERDEIPEVPVDAIREAVINAFAHRRIESGQAVDIAIDRSYIEVYSPGPFPDGVTPEMFIKESRRPIRRNPLITRTLYYSKDMESFATGLRRIQNLCDEAGVKVEYIGDLYGFTVRFHRHCGEGWAELGESDEPDVTLNDPQSDHEPQNGPQSISQNVTQSVTQNVTQNITQTTENSSFKEKDVTEKIIEIIKNDKNATRKSIARELSMTVRHVQRLLNKMPNVRYEGSSRSGHWVIIDDETKE